MLNSLMIVEAFVAAVRLVLGAIVVIGGLLLLAGRNRAARRGGEAGTSSRHTLLLAAAAVLAILAVASWPLLYATLQSLVPQWPAAMCLEGVMRLGTHSLGPSRYLPLLVRTTEALKPILVLLCGAWLVLWRLHQQSATGALAGRATAVLALVGAVAVADAAVEIAYVAIPKREDRLAAGCCSAAVQDRSLAAATRFSREPVPANRWTAGHFSLSAALVFGAVGLRRTANTRRRGWGLLGLAVATTAAVVAAAVFLSAVAAPWLMRLPHHRCVYCLFARVPETMAAALLFLSGGACVLWAAIAGTLGRIAATEAAADRMVARLLEVAAWLIAGSAVMLALELALVA